MERVDLSAETLTLEGGSLRWAGMLAAVGILSLVAAWFLAGLDAAPAEQADASAAEHAAAPVEHPAGTHGAVQSGHGEGQAVAEGAHGVSRFYRAYLVSFSFFLSLGLGALFFVLVSHLTRAGWSVAVRRVAEVFAWSLFALAPLAVIVVLGIDHLYEWSPGHPHFHADDALLQGKAPYLNTSFFIVRMVIYFVLWCGTASYFLGRSVAQDGSGRPRETLWMERLAAPATMVFALTTTFAAFDLLMSLYPHWYSTIWGVYYFAGCLVGFFSLMAITLHLMRRAGYLRRTISAEHFHDIGKLMFAFVVFWAYIAFSQYLLIWYGNIPEETIWYQERQTGQWTAVSLLLLFGHFLLPFLFLISRHPKRRGRTLVAGAVWLLIMHWVDLYWIVMPQASPGRIGLSLQDLLTFLGVGGIFFSVAIWRMSRQPLIPVRDPRLRESLQFENV